MKGLPPLVFVKLGSTFTRIKGVIKGKTILTTSASAMLDKGSPLNPKTTKNSNVPTKPMAKNNFMPLPHLVESIEVNGVNQQAQELNYGEKQLYNFETLQLRNFTLLQHLLFLTLSTNLMNLDGIDLLLLIKTHN